MTVGVIVAAAVVVAIVLLHYEALRLVDALTRRVRRPRRAALAVIFGVLAAHLVEIGVYALVYVAGAHAGIGALNGGPDVGAERYFYFSAETYTTLGFGDIVPVGDLRLLTCIEPLLGLLLMAWSASYTYLVVQRAAP